jgi:hypothetical protein
LAVLVPRREILDRERGGREKPNEEDEDRVA